MILIQSPRLQLSQFQMSDAKDVFECITPSITKFMRWEPLPWNEYLQLCEKRAQTEDPNSFHFVIRQRDNKECLGRCALEEAGTAKPEIGLWIKESAHGQGFGREVVSALVDWGFKTLNKESFIYPVAVENTASRRIAEGLGGELIGNRSNPKYESVVYRIPKMPLKNR
jgi:RimJ/RimL family protein N-acetyltransferase